MCQANWLSASCWRQYYEYINSVSFKISVWMSNSICFTAASIWRMMLPWHCGVFRHLLVAKFLCDNVFLFCGQMTDDNDRISCEFTTYVSLFPSYFSFPFSWIYLTWYMLNMSIMCPLALFHTVGKWMNQSFPSTLDHRNN